mgnify:CR=1 FL=1
MFNHAWYQDKQPNKELTLGWLYNSRISNDFAQGYTKNLLDYWSVESFIYGFTTQFVSDTFEDLCKQAHEAGYSKILVLKQGTSLGADFYKEFAKFYDDNKDAKFVGHILDKSENYYSIHPQTFMLDLNWWANAGFPKFGGYSSESIITIQPERSTDNWHDEYTPKWVKKPIGAIFRKYENTEEGWNLVKALIEDNQKIISWNEEIRENKSYGYPEVKFDGPRHLQSQLEQIIGGGGFFIANTENLPITKFALQERIEKYKSPGRTHFDGKFDQIIVPAAGMSPLIYAFKFNLKKGQRLVIYDVNKFAINLTRRIIEEYKGQDYIDFAHNLMDSYIKPGEEWNDYFKGVPQLGDMKETIEKLNKKGFQQWIDDILPTLQITVHLIMIF